MSAHERGREASTLHVDSHKFRSLLHIQYYKYNRAMRATPAVFFPSGEKMVICKLSCRHFLCFPPLTDWLTDSMCCCGPVYALVDGFILQHTGLYPIVSKGMRLIAQGKDPLEGQRHMCGMGNMFNYHSTGFPELDELMRTPQSLIFIMELLQVCFTFISFLENILF